MAAVASSADMTILKNSKILVNVEEALADLLVVTYCTEDKKFQGVLLDSNKGNLPFGVYGLNPALSRESTKEESENDKLHSVNQRFIYQDPDYEAENSQKSKKSGPKGKPQKRQKMTVRLRARKVLCSNCKGICNENNENVDVSKKRKHDSDDDIPADYIDSSKNDKKYLMSSTLIPKLSRLHPSEISSAIKGPSKNSNKPTSRYTRNAKSEKVDKNHSDTQELTFVSVSNDVSYNCDNETATNSSETFSSAFPSARTLKICFGEGEGTVVKIPPITGDLNEDSGVSCDIVKPDIKAAKKAMKRAKKQARKDTSTVSRTESWTDCPNKHIGALSPRNNVSPPPIDPLEKKHKHKVKHKKKHRLQKTRDENMSKFSDGESINYFSDIKDHCLKQKLSISLRRLSSNSFEKRNNPDGDESTTDEWESDTLPEFPETAPEVAGRKFIRVLPGDIVWGKVVGFPWWPGRVLSVTSAAKAHVAWFASTTSSLMSFDSLSPFLEDYKIRFNKRKRGPYKEAVKLATIEAKRSESHTEDPLASPKQNLATLSPRAIDVFS